MAGQLRALPPLPDDPRSLLSTQGRRLTSTCNFRPRGSLPSVAPEGSCTQTHAYIHIQKVKINLQKILKKTTEEHYNVLFLGINSQGDRIWERIATVLVLKLEGKWLRSH